MSKSERALAIALESGLENCARCGQTHPDKLDWHKFVNPPPSFGTLGQFMYWAPCPTNGDPILLYVAQDD